MGSELVCLWRWVLKTLAIQHDPHALDLTMGFQNRLRAAADHYLPLVVFGSTGTIGYYLGG